MATLVTFLFILFGAALTAYMALYAYGVYRSIPEKGGKALWLAMFFVVILADVACFAGTVMMTVGFVMKGEG